MGIVPAAGLGATFCEVEDCTERPETERAAGRAVETPETPEAVGVPRAGDFGGVDTIGGARTDPARTDGAFGAPATEEYSREPG
jgi:hypothetical protein